MADLIIPLKPLLCDDGKQKQLRMKMPQELKQQPSMCPTPTPTSGKQGFCPHPMEKLITGLWGVKPTAPQLSQCRGARARGALSVDEKGCLPVAQLRKL